MEITCPKCGFTRNIPDEKIPARAEIATCPKCKEKFQFRTTTETLPPPLLSEKSQDQDPSPPVDPEVPENDSPRKTSQTQESEKAGAGNGDFWDSLASMGSPHQETRHDHDSDVTPNGEIEVPWERLDIHGFFPGMWETIKRAMLRPVGFFQAMPVGSGQIKPLIFYLLIALFQIVMQMLWEMTGVAPGMAGDGEAMGANMLMLLVGYPAILTVLLYIMAVLVHACLNLVGGATRGFEGTFRALTYGSAPMVMTIVPVIGPLIGAIWSLVVTFLGYKHIHGTTTAKVILAMLLPLIPFVLILAVVMSMAQNSGVPTF
ncbi:YIP1 family protein [Desulfonatronum parangueonense]